MSLQGWYPVALSRDIAAGTSAGTRVLGEEFVVWRDSKGAVHAWEDRCPHRGMKMSFGFVRGDHIACLYHGWQYDTAGQCRHIPAHPDLEVPQTIKIPRFATVEAGGMIWGCFNGENSDAPPAPDLPAEVTPLRSVFADCPAPLMVARIAKTPFGQTTPDVAAKTDRIVEVTLGDTKLIAGVQAIADGESALHLVALGDVDASKLKPLSLWAEQLRRDAEAAAGTSATAEIAA